MNLDQIDRLLVDALPWLSVTVLPVLLIVAAVSIYLYGPAGEEDDYTVADYAKPVLNGHPASLRRYLTIDRQRAEVVAAIRRGRPMVLGPAATVTPHVADILPPAPPGVNAGAPLYAALAARRWLREIATEQQTAAGIRPSYATADRDMVGAFPVVRVA